MSVTPDPASPDDAPDLDALDAALSPLRRALHWARPGSGREPRYLGAIGGRWLARARALAVPPAVDDLLVEMAEALDGFDQSDADDRAERLAVVFASLARVDGLLGLPLPASRPAREASTDTTSSGDGSSDDADTSRRGSGGRRGRKRSRSKGRKGSRPSRTSTKGRGKGKSKAQVERDEPQTRDPVRLGESTSGARALTDLEAPVDVLAALDDEVDVTTVLDLITLRPIGEDVVQPVLGAGRLTEPGRAAVGGRVRQRRTRIAADGTRTTEVLLQGAGPTWLRWSGGAPVWLVDRLAPGARTVVVGTVEIPEEGPSVVHDPELAVDDGKHAVRLATYDLPGIDDAAVRALVHQALGHLQPVLEPLPAALIRQHDLLGLGDALEQGHHLGRRARAATRRLAYDEALLVQLGALWERFQGSKERGIPHTVLHNLAARGLQLLDATLTDEQQAAFEDVKRGLRDSTPMRRVLTGEVGAGKGLVALLSMVLVAENKHQVMVLAPDRATAEQRYAFTEPLLRDLGLVARLVDAEPSRAQRDALRRGEVHVVFGTEALLEADLEFRRLGLIVAGERDRFGSVPPKVARLRSPQPDLLVITSTPVPWPVLLQAYPAFDITVLEQLPGKSVRCEVHPAAEREGAYAQARAAVSRGEQVAVVFPMHRGVDVLDVREALRVVSTLETQVFEGAQVKLFHGAMSREERYRTYQDFRDGRIDVLVATTHFEAGPAVPGVSTIVVEQADRMTPSRLHRVRGHVSVGAGDPLLVLVTGETPDHSGLEWVQAFATHQDGFSVSVQELEQRGLAAMLAVEPGPEPTFSWLDPLRDLQTLGQARRDARDLLEADRGLRRGGAIELARYLKARWDGLLDEDCPVQVNSGGSRRRRRRRKR